jgi:hypothetical protein
MPVDKGGQEPGDCAMTAIVPTGGLRPPLLRRSPACGRQQRSQQALAERTSFRGTRRHPSLGTEIDATLLRTQGRRKALTWVEVLIE